MRAGLALARPARDAPVGPTCRSVRVRGMPGEAADALRSAGGAFLEGTGASAPAAQTHRYMYIVQAARRVLGRL